MYTVCIICCVAAVNPAGAIAGAVVGSLVFVFIILAIVVVIIVLLYYYRYSYTFISPFSIHVYLPVSWLNTIYCSINDSLCSAIHIVIFNLYRQRSEKLTFDHDTHEQAFTKVAHATNPMLYTSTLQFYRIRIALKS